MTTAFIPGTWNRRVEGVLMGKVAYNIYAPVENPEIHFIRRDRNGDWVIQFGGKVESVPYSHLRDAVNSVKSIFDIQGN